MRAPTELVHDAARGRWPRSEDVEAWRELANFALQTETLAVDIAENRDWEARMEALVARGLPYIDYVRERQAALDSRTRRRKRDQTNLRYKYGFKDGDRPRNPALVRADVRKTLRSEVARLS